MNRQIYKNKALNNTHLARFRVRNFKWLYPHPILAHESSILGLLDEKLMDEKSRIYLSGAISEDRDYEHKFAVVKRYLGNCGFYNVFSPVGVGLRKRYRPCNSWLQFMAVDLQQLYKSHIVCLLPGWEKSSGARIEAISAIQRNIIIVMFTSILDIYGFEKFKPYDFKPAVKYFSEYKL